MQPLSHAAILTLIYAASTSLVSLAGLMAPAGLTPPAYSQDTTPADTTPDTTPDRQSLERLSAQQEEAEAEREHLDAQRAQTLREIDRLQNDLVSTAAEAASYEGAQRNMIDRLKALEAEEASLNSTIFQNRGNLTQLLAALQRIERNPPPALAINPQDAKDAAQSARLLSAISAQLKERANILSGQLSALGDVKSNIIAQKTELEDNLAALSTRRTKLTDTVSEKQQLEASISEQSEERSQRIAKLAADAVSLRELITRFEQRARAVQPRVKPGTAAPPPSQNVTTDNGIPIPKLKPRSGLPPEPLELPPETQRFADARGLLRAPARGQIITRYNVRQPDGERSKGFTVRTLSEAQVLSPYAGRIEFAGAFKNYDNVVIINVGEDYFILMTGLGDVFGKEGQNVKAGEPVGLMPFNVTEGPKLYIEIRKSGLTIDPTPWLGTAFARHG